MKSTSTDLDILTQISNGNSSAFQIVYRQYADALYVYVYNRIYDNKRRKEISEDIIQEVFTSLWARRRRIKIKHSLKQYLLGACKNKVLNFIRSEQLRQRHTYDFGLTVTHYVNDLDHTTNLMDISKIIEDTATRLSPQCQTAFRLSRFDYLPPAEIAAKMSISKRTVENYLSKALGHLRTNLSDYKCPNCR